MKKSPYVVINCAALAILAFAAWYLARTHSTGHLRVTTVVPANGVPEAVAISPDGNSVAMMNTESFTPDGSSTTKAIEVHDIRSGRVDRFSLPQASFGVGHSGYYVSPPLRYCDGGKYLLAFNGPDTLSVVDVRTLQLHTSIALSSLPKRMAGLGRAVLDCSAESSVAALADGNPLAMGASMLALLDLDNGTEIADLSDSLNGRYQGDGIAISPNGTQLAVATWRFGAGEGSTLELINIPEKKSIGHIALPKSIRESIREPRHQLSFAGEHAVMVGELGCDDQSEQCGPATGLTFRVIDLSSGGADRVLTRPGMEAYRFSGASADGDVVFGYTGAESRCTSCNEGYGKVKISDERFTVWDRNSGRVVAQSPSLHVQVHSCWLALGSCTEYERPSELQMNEDGKAVLAFSPPLDYAQAKPGDAKVEVFYRR